MDDGVHHPGIRVGLRVITAEIQGDTRGLAASRRNRHPREPVSVASDRVTSGSAPGTHESRRAAVTVGGEQFSLSPIPICDFNLKKTEEQMQSCWEGGKHVGERRPSTEKRKEAQMGGGGGVGGGGGKRVHPPFRL